jgi:3-oxoacyl-[acyl-carrier-protein] synthase III
VQICDKVFLRSLGTHVPAQVSVRWAIEQGLYDPGAVAMARLDGTSVAGDTSAAEMAVTAAGTALRNADQDSASLDYMIHASVFGPGPDGWSLPGYALLRLGGGTATVTELRTGCGAMLNAIELGVGLITGSPRRDNVLITAADNFEPWVQRWRSFAFILGDAGSAALLSGTSGFARIKSLNSRTIPELEAMYRGDEPLFPPAAASKPLDENARFDTFTRLIMPALDAATLMAGVHVDLVRRSAEEAGVKVGDLSRIIFHNMAWFSVERFLMDPIGLPMERTCFDIGRGLGHMGCSDQVVSLERLLARGELVPGDHVLLLGGSAGFASTAVVLEILEIPAWAGPASTR